MALFKVNTGMRDKEVCFLEVGVGSARTGIGHQRVHHSGRPGEERRRALGGVESSGGSVIDGVRRAHAEYMFRLGGHPIPAMGNSA